MCCFKLFIAGHTIKTAAALSAVVFLLCFAGCCTATDGNCSEKRINKSRNQEKFRKRPIRRRASDYSRIPGNYPAGWQTSTIGN